MKDDLISRKAAIDAVSRGCQEFRGIFAECEKNLNALPAVQTCDDAVSRQAAINAVKKNTFRLTFAEEQGCEGHVVWSAEAVYSDVIEGALLELPSTQSHDIARDIATIIENEKDMRVILKNAQPDAPDTNGGDIIYRQAAIDVMCELMRHWFGGDPKDEVREIKRELEKLPSIPTCDDAVSRQAAIDALMKRDKELRNINWYDKPFAEGECKGIDYALEIVNALPSVQPTQSNAYNALKTLDCIDRQAAIDKLNPLFESLAIDKIKALPTVQPQPVVRCKDCKYWKDSDGVYRRGVNAESKCPLNTQEVYAGTFYCGYAERRTDD